ncbi:peptidase C26 [Syntrophobotulus glycolicus DSM 8271]|uniref:Peptidase C26 n=1 Tax=Syntrophobotulus glycolicus (strain DSM 8271 / FlGlyR) TaxID=645991 RepID=F0STR6_SYNGF|nr:gamma-glutamyl-gamma-aminobutyrate hydrolase family protein [Syntrophobotulus glycolicus]ADY55356.1 peptidase C26 [Syntrophobotulus glycolicus DSM 8271]
MHKSTIGVIPLWDEDKNSIWMLPGYLDGIIAAGGCPVILPLTDDDQIIRQLAAAYDGFLFTGGHDVSPALYHQAKSDQCGFVVEIRDSMESQLLTRLIDLDKPVFGICRGIQMLNVLLGGSLYQDLNTQFPSTIQHKQLPPYDTPAHRLEIAKDSPLHDLLRKDAIHVNSYHHQAIHTISPQLTVMAAAPDGLAEAVCLPAKKFVWAVQWHPEYSLPDESSKQLFSAFVDACQPDQG